MTSSLNSCDVIVVRFPFASSLKYKARPAVIISSDNYNKNGRQNFIILAISSQIQSKLNWEEAGLLKPSIFKASIATIEGDSIVTKLGKLSIIDERSLKILLKTVIFS